MTTRSRMVGRTLEQDYFEWLCAQVWTGGSGQEYWELLEAFHGKEFLWVIANDDNRIADGLDLLVEYFHYRGLAVETIREDGRGCTCLELLIGLSRRLSSLADRAPHEWAWILLGNLGFHTMSDPLTRTNHRTIETALNRVIWRTYHPNGRGGFFPLKHPDRDQRTVELWYQMNAYVIEMYDT